MCDLKRALELTPTGNIKIIEEMHLVKVFYLLLRLSITLCNYTVDLSLLYYICI